MTAGYGIGWVLGVVVWIDEVVFIKLNGTRMTRMTRIARINTDFSIIRVNRRNLCLMMLLSHTSMIWLLREHVRASEKLY